MSNGNDNKISDSSIFQFIRPSENDSFSMMSGFDLQDLLYYIDNYYLTLRDNLGLSSDITFGLELEFERAKYKNINDELNKNWKLKDDASLSKNFGFEINSPILRDYPNSWSELDEVCSLVSSNAIIGDLCGGHIHIGEQILGDKVQYWINFLKLWSIYENVIFRFTYGDYLSSRTFACHYAALMSSNFWKRYEDFIGRNNINLKTVVRELSFNKFQAVNFKNVSYSSAIYELKNTIEFRSPNGTLEPVVWQNNVNLLAKLLLYCKSNNYNDDILDNRRSINQDKYSSLELYDEIYLQQALELADMIFDNNLDKVYFLRQYLKNFEISNKPLKKAKSFIKNE